MLLVLLDSEKVITVKTLGYKQGTKNCPIISEDTASSLHLMAEDLVIPASRPESV